MSIVKSPNFCFLFLLVLFLVLTSFDSKVMLFMYYKLWNISSFPIIWNKFLMIRMLCSLNVGRNGRKASAGSGGGKCFGLVLWKF